MRDSYIGPTYEAIGPVQSFNGVPRFGHTTTIIEIFSSDGTIDNEKVSAYVSGTIFIAAFLIASYVLFTILTIVFKCRCSSKFPVLAGLPFSRESQKEQSRTFLIIRGFLLFSSFVVIISGILFLAKGMQSVGTTADVVRDGIDELIELSTSVISTADLFIEFGVNSVPLRNSLTAIVQKGVCTTFMGGTQTFEDFDRAAAMLVGVLNMLQNFSQNQIVTLRDTFADNALAGTLEDRISEIENQLNLAYYAGPAITLGILILCGLILAWLAVDVKYHVSIQKWFVIPVFFIFVSVSVFLVATVGVALVVNSDICIGNPSGTPEGFIKMFSDQNLNGTAKRAVNYFIVNGCDGQLEELVEIDNLLAGLHNATVASKNLQNFLVGNKATFEQACGGGVGSLDTFESTLGEAIIEFDEALVIGNNATNILKCQSVNEIWVDVIHDAVCTNAPTALAWMFSTAIAIYIAGMFIFIYRGALLPTAGVNDKYDDKKPSQTFEGAESEQSFQDDY